MDAKKERFDDGATDDRALAVGQGEVMMMMMMRRVRGDEGVAFAVRFSFNSTSSVWS